MATSATPRRTTSTRCSIRFSRRVATPGGSSRKRNAGAKPAFFIADEVKSFIGSGAGRAADIDHVAVTDRGILVDEAASAIGKSPSEDQQARLSQDIQERVITIFEACNFQDLTGQRIQKVMSTMKFIEHHITVMMEIWGGVDAIKAHAPPIVDERVGDARLLNGPKALGEEGHASQNDIDALFN